VNWVILGAACSGLFAGAAAYINLVEHPARLESGTAPAVAEFRPSYRLATRMQASLALVSSACGFLAWLQSRDPCVLAPALLILCVIPYTLLIVLPTNKQLLDPRLDPSSEEAGRLLGRWAALHAVRTVLGLAAFVGYLVALST